MMRKYIKKQILELISTLYEAHEAVGSLFDSGRTEDTLGLLADCQSTAVDIGGFIDDSEGEGLPVIHLLEEYCEAVYQVSVGSESTFSGAKARKSLNKVLIKVENSIKKEIPVQLEIVFMPYKATMWDSLESIWKAANNDPECKTYVVPIPYYDRNPNHSFSTFHYEGNLYPDYVPVIHYKDYDLTKHKPDIIYIHNPYDDNNYITSVDPEYYSDKLKQYTDMLVYCPYYFLERVHNWQFIAAKGALNADYIIAQSDRIRDVYLDVYTNDLGIPLSQVKNKVYALGSPKIDAIVDAKKEEHPLPDKWKHKIGNKKIVLYNTSLSALLYNRDKYIKKIASTLEYFDGCNDLILLWRPHPLFESTLNSMMPEYSSTFGRIKNTFIRNNIGIYDDTSDSTRPLIWSDIYYGDRNSTLFYSFVFTGKPVVFTDVDEAVTSNDYTQDCLKNSITNELRNDFMKNANIDGTAGYKIHNKMKEKAFES